MEQTVKLIKKKAPWCKTVVGGAVLTKEYAESIGAEFGASRGIVDMGLEDYSCQIGLTGRTVNPKIYIAVGISGAVHHTCAIESAQTIIAINPDKKARIFEYADFGILDKF